MPKGIVKTHLMVELPVASICLRATQAEVGGVGLPMFDNSAWMY